MRGRRWATRRAARMRDERDWTTRKYAMWERGEKLPSQTPSPRMRCPCVQQFDSHRLEQTLIHIPHIAEHQREVRNRSTLNPEKAARKLLEIANAVEPVQDGWIHIEKINAPFLNEYGSPAEYKQARARYRKSFSPRIVWMCNTARTMRAVKLVYTLRCRRCTIAAPYEPLQLRRAYSRDRRFSSRFFAKQRCGPEG